MTRRTKGRRLRIHRETIRTVSDRALGEVAGGTIVVLSVVNDTKVDESPQPRTNAWTGTSSFDAVC